MYFGRYDPSGTQYWGGLINEVSMWDEAFTLAKVQELYNDGIILDATLHSSYIADDDKLLTYHRNDGIGTWTDRSKNSNDGTPTGTLGTLLAPAGVDSSRDNQGFLMNRQKDTNSLNLDGVSAYMEKTDGINLMSGGTMSCWVKSSSTSETGKAVWNGIANTQHFSISLNAGDIRVTVVDGDTDGDVIGASGFAITTGWHFIVATYNGSDTVKLYVDGVLMSGSNVSELNRYEGLVIGARGVVYDNFFDGAVDDVLIYDDVLELAEVKRNYNAGKRSHR